MIIRSHGYPDIGSFNRGVHLAVPHKLWSCQDENQTWPLVAPGVYSVHHISGGVSFAIAGAGLVTLGPTRWHQSETLVMPVDGEHRGDYQVAVDYMPGMRLLCSDCVLPRDAKCEGWIRNSSWSHLRLVDLRRMLWLSRRLQGKVMASQQRLAVSKDKTAQRLNRYAKDSVFPLFTCL